MLSQDLEGDHIATALPIEEDARNSKPTAQLSKQAQRALGISRTMIAKPGSKVAEADWRSECDDQRVSPSDNPKTRNEAFKTAYQRLLEAGLVIAGGGVVWLPTGSDESKRDGGTEVEAEGRRSLLAE